MSRFSPRGHAAWLSGRTGEAGHAAGRAAVRDSGEAYGIAAMAAANPDKPALVLGDVVRSYGALEARIRQQARALQHAGIGPGSRVAVALHNSIEWFEILNALGRVGALLVPLSWRGRGPEFAWMLGDAAVSLLIAEPELAPELERALAIHPLAPERIWVVGTDGASAWRGLGFDEVMAAESAAELDASFLPGGGYDVMIYTSGTTGRPRGIVRDAVVPGQGLAQMRGAAAMWGYGADEVHLVPGPVYHTASGSFGQMHLAVGATVVVMPHFDAASALHLIERHRVTNTQMVPAMFVRILALPEAERAAIDLSSIQRVLHAAAPCPVAVKQKIMEVFPAGVVWEFYGASEGGGTRISPEEWLARPGSVGRPWPGYAVEIRDDAGEILGPGEIGTVWVRPPQGLRFSYSNDPEKSEAAWRAGAFTVGDLGHLDSEGYLFLADRRSDLILSGGANVYPAEVEGVLFRHPAVLDAAVVGIADERMGQSVAAVIELRAAGSATAEEIAAFCRGELASWKCPRRIEIVAELPREPSGKIRKFLLREALEQGRPISAL